MKLIKTFYLYPIYISLYQSADDTTYETYVGSTKTSRMPIRPYIPIDCRHMALTLNEAIKELTEHGWKPIDDHYVDPSGALQIETLDNIS